MISKYGIFCKAVELGNFTRAGDELGYSQSAISQAVKSMEQELGTTLLDRRKDGVVLTDDGQSYYPFIRNIWQAELALDGKHREMDGLEGSRIRIGAFTSITRRRLLPLMKEFKEQYPSVTFELLQGEYTSIERWIGEGAIDFGFTNLDAAPGYESRMLFREDMLALFPEDHSAGRGADITLTDIAREPFILLDEGEDYSVPLIAFEKAGLEPEIAYKVTDDYTILEMVRQGFGVSMTYPQVLEDGLADGLAILPIRNAPYRQIGIIWKNWETMPVAAKRFVDFISTSFRV